MGDACFPLSLFGRVTRATFTLRREPHRMTSPLRTTKHNERQRATHSCFCFVEVGGDSEPWKHFQAESICRGTVAGGLGTPPEKAQGRTLRIPGARPSCATVFSGGVPTPPYRPAP